MIDQPLGQEWWRPVASPVAVAEGQAAPATRDGRGDTPLPFRALVLFTFVLILSPQTLVPLLAQLRIALVLAAVAIGSHVYHAYTQGRPVLILTREARIALLLFGWGFVTVPMSLWPGGSLSLLFSVYFKTLALFFLLPAVVNTPDRLRKMGWALTLSAGPLAVTAIQNFLRGNVISAEAHETRIRGFDAALTSNPNDLALILNLILPLILALTLSAKRVTTRIVLLGLLALDAVGVIVTFSRGGFLGLATIVVAYLWTLRKRPERRFIQAALLVAVLAVPLLPARYMDRIGTIRDIDSDSTGSSQARWRDMTYAALYIVQNPLIGAGLGQDVMALNQIRGATWLAVHNTYLEYGVDLGLPGMIMFGLLVVGSIRCAALVQQQAARSTGFSEMFHLAGAIKISLLAYAVEAQFHPSGYNVPFYFFAGLALAARNAFGGVTSPAGEEPVRAEWEVRRT